MKHKFERGDLVSLKLRPARIVERREWYDGTPVYGVEYDDAHSPAHLTPIYAPESALIFLKRVVYRTLWKYTIRHSSHYKGRFCIDYKRLGINDVDTLLADNLISVDMAMKVLQRGEIALKENADLLRNEARVNYEAAYRYLRENRGVLLERMQRIIRVYDDPQAEWNVWRRQTPAAEADWYVNFFINNFPIGVNYDSRRAAARTFVSQFVRKV